MLDADGGRPPPRRGPVARPPDTHRFCSVLGSGTRVARPCRSAAPEWHVLHLACEVLLAGLRVAQQDVELDGRSRRRAALVAALRLQAVQIGGDGLDVRVGNRQRQHQRARTAVLHDRRDELAVLVVEHQLRAQQVGPTELSAARVHAVAGAARADVDATAALEDRGVHRRPLMRRKPRRPLRKPALRPGGRRRRLRARRRRSAMPFSGRLRRRGGLLRPGGDRQSQHRSDNCTCPNLHVRPFSFRQSDRCNHTARLLSLAQYV